MRDRGQMLVVAGLGSPAYDLHAAGDHDANFYLWGAMGAAALMGLGGLATIGIATLRDRLYEPVTVPRLFVLKVKAEACLAPSRCATPST